MEVCMGQLELISFRIISAVGTAKSNFIQAIGEAKKGNMNKARELIKKGEHVFLEGHEAHSKLIQQEAKGDLVNPSLLLLHAEDQLMSAETIKIIAVNLIEVFERIVALESKKR